MLKNDITDMIDRRWPLLALAAVLACVWCAYSPGLHGGFLFDDFVNLDALGATGRIDDWPTFWRYLTSGSADPTGRPIAVLSFLIDARDWPADPWPFLRTNVTIHLVNAALLFLLLRQLGGWIERGSLRTPVEPSGAIGGDMPEGDASGSASPRSRAPSMRVEFAAVLGAGLWALHPLLVSTTLYVIQREALLAATFTLLGLLAWGRGRQLIEHSPRKGAAWMLAGIGVGTVLAMLCKANGALLPLLAWALEATVYHDAVETRLARRLRWLLLVLPGLLLCAYVLSFLAQWSTPLSARPWLIGQRVMTEPRVLLDYLRTLLVPRVLSTGVYNDSYAVSTSLLQPGTTLPAILAVLALVGAALALRRRVPVLAAALLFFFCGHLLESTTIPLELYFEHRNYLPAMLLGWALARCVVGWRAPVALRAAVGAGMLALLTVISWQRATLWADQPRMAALWATTNPGSSRAIATQAMFDIRDNHPELAMALLSEPWQRRPYDLQLALNYVSAACRAQGPTPRVVAAVDAALRNANEGDQLVYRWLGNVVDVAQAGGCPGTGLDTVQRWTRAALANKRLASMPGRQQDLRAVLGRVALARGDATGALQEFQLALDAWPTPDAAAQQAAWLAAAGHPAEGLALLDHYATVAPRREQPHGWNMSHLHQWVLDRQAYWPHEFAELRRKMREDLAAQGARP